MWHMVDKQFLKTMNERRKFSAEQLSISVANLSNNFCDKEISN